MQDVSYITLSSIGAAYLNAEAYGGGKVQLSLEDIREMVLPVPPLAEQRAITQYLDNELQKLATLRGTAQQVIALLQERRAALISAAVTGQLDLSSWQRPEPEAVAEVA